MSRWIQFAQVLAEELLCREELPRVPEPSLVMTSPRSVDEYADAGRLGGPLVASHLYHAAQICRLVCPGDTVVDLGCGPAGLLSRLAELNGAARFIGVDLSDAMLQRAAATLAEAHIENVELCNDDIERLASLGDGSATVVISSMTLHHLSDCAALHRTFVATARVLRPGGGVYLADFGRLRRTRSINYFVARSRGTPTLQRDYAQSLGAAFSRDELARAASHLSAPVRVHATPISALLVVIRTAPRREARSERAALREVSHALPSHQRADLRDLAWFLRLGGLRNALA